MDFYELARRRQSVRSFKTTPVTEEQKREIREHFFQSAHLIPDIELELHFIEDGKEKLEGHAGYEGFTFEAPCYIALLSEVKDHYLENAGYVNESIALKLTQMGLASCWITVNEPVAVKKLLQPSKDKAAVCLLAVGYPEKEKTSYQLHINTPADIAIEEREGHIAPKMSLGEMVYQGAWKKRADLDENYIDMGLRNALNAASMAPTFINRQPFRFIMDEGKLIYVKLSDSYTIEEDEKLNCGAVMFNFASVLSDRRPYEVIWKLEKPHKEYELPEDCTIVGYCEI